MLMSDLFDILNSKSRFGKHYKQPLTNDNEGHIMNAIETLSLAILSIENAKAQKIIWEVFFKCFLYRLYMSYSWL